MCLRDQLLWFSTNLLLISAKSRWGIFFFVFGLDIEWTRWNYPLDLSQFKQHLMRRNVQKTLGMACDIYKQRLDIWSHLLHWNQQTKTERVLWTLVQLLMIRFWRIVLLKVAYYATSSARNFAKLCQNYARIPKLCSWFSKLCSQNDVDSVHIGAQKRHQSIMFFKYVVVGNLYVFYGSLSRPSAVQTAHAEFVKRGLVTKHVRTKSILLLAKLKHAL